MENVQTLLTATAAIEQRHAANSSKTAQHFNAFTITGIGADEIRICKMLRELLDPKGTHGQGPAFLKPFIEDVLLIDKNAFNHPDYMQATVESEHSINNNRRIDLLLTIGSGKNRYCIPIEVKVYADDQPAQCYEYHRWLNGQTSKNKTLYYLTLYGVSPSEESIRGYDGELKKSQDYTHADDFASYEGVSPLSFKTDIIRWLQYCIRQDHIRANQLVCEVIAQFIRVLESLTSSMADKNEKEIIKALIASPDNFRSAMAVVAANDKAAQAIMTNFFNDLDIRFRENYSLECQENNEFDYRSLKASKYPGISYLVDDTLPDGCQLWFRMEFHHDIGGPLVMGYVIAKGSNKGADYPMSGSIVDDSHLDQQLLRKQFEKLAIHQHGWWYLRDDSLKSEPGPRYHAQNQYKGFADLLDPQEKQRFISDVCDRAGTLLKISQRYYHFRADTLLRTARQYHNSGRNSQ